MFGKDVESGARRPAPLLILVFEGIGEEWDGAPVAQASQLAGCRGAHCRVVIGQSVPQLRERIPAHERGEGEDGPRPVFRRPAAMSSAILKYAGRP